MIKLPNPTPAEITALRAAYGLTQAQCAALLNTSVRAYRQWELGERGMHVTFWQLLRLKLGLPLHSL